VSACARIVSAITTSRAICALATATRLTGLALVAGLGVEYLLQNREQLRSARVWTRAIAGGLAGSVGFLAYLAINFRVHGNAFAFLGFQSAHWQRSLASPLPAPRR
jgi:uncharacterized membrane protein YbhN (UPF0104 family)